MTTFLTRLAERSLGMTPRVQPLVASHFSSETPEHFPSDSLGEEHLLTTDASAAVIQTSTPPADKDSLSAIEPLIPRPDSIRQATSQDDEIVEETSIRSETSPELDAQKPAPPGDALAIPSTPPIQPPANPPSSLLPSMESDIDAADIDAASTKLPLNPIQPMPSPAQTSTHQPTQTPAAATAPVPENVEAFKSQPAQNRSQRPVVAQHQVTQGTRQTTNVEVRDIAPSDREQRNLKSDREQRNIESDREQRHLKQHDIETEPTQSDADQLRTAESRATSILVSPVLQPTSETTNSTGNRTHQSPADTAPRPAESNARQPVTIADRQEYAPINDEPSSPVIRVTIGRVEVRANLPPAQTTQPPAPKRASPVVSLDQYLKQISEGQR